MSDDNSVGDIISAISSLAQIIAGEETNTSDNPLVSESDEDNGFWKILEKWFGGNAPTNPQYPICPFCSKRIGSPTILFNDCVFCNKK